MISTIKIVVLHAFILAVQAFYMYISSKTQVKEHKYLYLIALPVVMCIPVLISRQSPAAYSLYEYALVFCIIFAAIADSTVASFTDKDIMTGSSWCKYLCSYLLICAVSFLYGKAAVIPGVIAALIFAAFAVYCVIRKRLSLLDVLKAAVLAAASLVCSWGFIDWLL